MPAGRALETVGLRREYVSGDAAVAALDGVTLTVDAGELVAVMGPSGSGKSTLLSICGGLDTATAGEVWVEGVALHGLAPAAAARLRRDHVGFVFQDFNLVAGLTATENVMLPRELAGVSWRMARREALEALSSMGLEELGGRFPEQLSGGQQQRVAIARAIIGTRRLILADEPTGALDSATSELVLRVVRDRVDAGAAAMVVTHDESVAGWADRVVHLRDGRVVDIVSPAGAPA